MPSVVVNDQHKTHMDTSASHQRHPSSSVPGTIAKPSMAFDGLVGQWEATLTKDCWSQEASHVFAMAWAPSTLALYDKAILQFAQYCEECVLPFPHASEATIATYLCILSENSECPSSQLTTFRAAWTAHTHSLCMANAFDSYRIGYLVSALVKTGTKAAMTRSSVMPVEPFFKLFQDWGPSVTLPLEKLRLKAVTLLALAMMLRQSDIAPWSKYHDASGVLQSVLFTTRDICFLQNGAMQVMLFAIKNDYHRQGFDVMVQPAWIECLCPVRTLRQYIKRTQYIRPASGAVFLTLDNPPAPMSSTAVARVLESAIHAAGLTGFTAKSFHPTGATHAIANGLNPDYVHRVGHWRDQVMFENHYVHAAPPTNFTSVLYGLDTLDKTNKTSKLSAGFVN